MRTLITGFLILVVWAIPCRYWYVCKIKRHCAGEHIETETGPISARAHDLRLQDGSTTLLEGREQFHFAANAVDAELSADNRRFLDEIAAWMNEHPGRVLTVTGAWRPSEAGQTSGFFENLGLARAAWIRDRLVERKVPEQRIGLDHAASMEEMLNYPVRFDLQPLAVENQAAPTVQAAAFTFSNMQFSGANFASNSARFEPSPGFIAYADSLATYLELHSGKTLVITGHTDSRGEESANKALGQRRADAVREWLLSRGIRAPIETRSVGAAEPVADNGTEDGRTRNRRVQITIR